MLSSDDLEMLIVSKKREIEKEKALLGIMPPPTIYHEEEDKENAQPDIPQKQVTFQEDCISNSKQERRILSEQQDESSAKKESDKTDLYDLEEKIPPDLERYIRRYIGIPAMLKAGEYSPNNPLLRAELNTDRAAGDAFLGLGEYERRRNTLRKIRQAQYRQYLDQQAKKKQEAKEQAEQERRDREEKERQREERERQLLLERERYSPEQRRASVCSVPINNAPAQTNKVDTGVQVDSMSSPLSVAVQTDDVDLYQLTPSPSKCLTQAERELSPRTVSDTKHSNWNQKLETCERRRSYGDFDERTCSIKKSNRDLLVSDLRHSYMPSIFDADAIHMRNLQAEKEAAARRQFYQQELKNQILEQQRIREERKSREKMLEQAEMRRLEEQLRMLRVAQERERDRQHDISTAMKENRKEFDTKRTELQREIDIEQLKLTQSKTQPQPLQQNTRQINTSKSDPPRSKLPFFYNTEKAFQPIENKKPYSFNIPDNSVFSSNYDVDSYLRKNLNFREKIDSDFDNIGSKNTQSNVKIQDVERTSSDNKLERNEINTNVEFDRKIQSNPINKFERDPTSNTNVDMDRKTQCNNIKFERNQTNNTNIEIERKIQPNNNKFERNPTNNINFDMDRKIQTNNNKIERNILIEKALIHEAKNKMPERNTYDEVDNISIPVLRHSPQSKNIPNENTTKLSDAMKRVDDKWKVPAVQKNILKSLPNEQGKNISILTQLGSIRRQLQLEQLKLDKMLSKSDS